MDKINEDALSWWNGFDLVTKIHIAQDWVYDAKQGAYQKSLNFHQIDKDNKCIVAMYNKHQSAVILKKY